MNNFTKTQNFTETQNCINKLNQLQMIIENNNLSKNEIENISDTLDFLIQNIQQQQQNIQQQQQQNIQQQSQEDLDPKIIEYLFLGWYVNEVFKNLSS